MLDLKMLENQLTEALERETSESLSLWLKNRRINNFLNSFGEGSLSDFDSRNFIITQTKDHLIEKTAKEYSDDFNPMCGYQFAA